VHGSASTCHQAIAERYLSSDLIRTGTISGVRDHLRNTREHLSGWLDKSSRRLVWSPGPGGS
jgi:hypothetical protein